MKAQVHVYLKSGVLDPQGRAIGRALLNLGYDGVDDVRQGKLIELELAEIGVQQGESVTEQAATACYSAVAVHQAPPVRRRRRSTQ